MRDLLILCGVGILSAAAWTATAYASGRGPHGPPLHGGLVDQMKHRASHVEHHMGIFFPSAPAHQFMDQLPGEPGPAPAHLGMPMGGVMVGGPEHMISPHLAVPAIHPIAHVAARVESGQAANTQPTAPGADDSDQEGAATAQPNPPTASPLAPRPPGAVGPGRLMFGRSGPGLPGPGRPPSPGW
jgi:hypothetical protein